MWSKQPRVEWKNSLSPVLKRLWFGVNNTTLSKDDTEGNVEV